MHRLQDRFGVWERGSRRRNWVIEQERRQEMGPHFAEGYAGQAYGTLYDG